ncbi:MAG: PDZ domain-containing protein [Planctomycetes bacterium]|nr:PDZ domain-containing protein [Planctomycetota bacterium]
MRHLTGVAAIIGLLTIVMQLSAEPDGNQTGNTAVAQAGGSTTRPASGSASQPATNPAARARKLADLNRKLFKLFDEKKYGDCKTVLDQILKLSPDDNIAWYNMACAQARLGETRESLDSLNKAVEFGYAGFRHLERDADLDSLRKTDEYKKIIAQKDEIQRRRADKIRKLLENQFGEGYIYQIDHDSKLVFATNIDETTLDEVKAKLTAHAQGLWKTLFKFPFEQYVSIVVPKEGTIKTPGLGGYYQNDTRILVSRTIGEELIHEFTHALHFADQEGRGQEHPIWIIEGMGTLFETSELRNGKVVPGHSSRLNMLKEIVRRELNTPWEDFFAFNQRDFLNGQEQTMISYCQSRYIMMYLHERGLLEKWYGEYVGGWEKDKTGRAAFEKVFGKELPEIENDWLAWIKQLKPPAIYLPPNHAYLGVRVEQAVDGLRIIDVVDGSGASKAGLMSQDVIVKINDSRIANHSELIKLVDKCKVGDKLKVNLRRDGEYQTVDVTLGAMPGGMNMPATAPSTPASSPSTAPSRRPPRRRPATTTSRPASSSAASAVPAAPATE